MKADTSRDGAQHWRKQFVESYLDNGAELPSLRPRMTILLATS
jgi:hypothetical protein